jgi:hypothetical protein
MKLGSSEDFQHDTATNGGVNICEHLIAGKKGTEFLGPDALCFGVEM